jgi:hypothetical protein
MAEAGSFEARLTELKSLFERGLLQQNVYEVPNLEHSLATLWNTQ